MSKFSVQIDEAELARIDNTLRFIGGESSKALYRAINRTLEGVRTDATDIIAEEVNLPKSFIRSGGSKKSQQTFFLRKASLSDPSGMIRIQGANVPLIQYSNQRSVKKSYAKKIIVQVRKDRGKFQMHHMFIPVLHSGHRGLFHVLSGMKTRTGRPAIEEEYGPRIPDILSNKDNFDLLMQKAQVRLDERLRHEVDYILDQGGRQ